MNWWTRYLCNWWGAHEWDKWEDPYDVKGADIFGNKFHRSYQVRRCLRCNLIESNKVRVKSD